MASYPSLLLFLSLLVSAPLIAENETPLQEPSIQDALDVSKLSEAFGHLIGKNIETMGVKFDLAQLIKGLQDAAAGKAAPMTEGECVKAISAAQESVFREQALENLKKAEDFMEKNSKEKQVVILEKGKLHYKIEKQGKGPEVLPNSSPLIRYTGKYLDGSVFGSSKGEESISLDEAIPGFSKGLIGMKEGEKRVLYIHPNLAYGTSGYLPPNSLLTFEIELIKTHTSQPASAHAASVEKAPPETPIEQAPSLR